MAIEKVHIHNNTSIIQDEVSIIPIVYSYIHCDGVGLCDQLLRYWLIGLDSFQYSQTQESLHFFHHVSVYKPVHSSCVAVTMISVCFIHITNITLGSMPHSYSLCAILTLKAVDA